MVCWFMATLAWYNAKKCRWGGSNSHGEKLTSRVPVGCVCQFRHACISRSRWLFTSWWGQRAGFFANLFDRREYAADGICTRTGLLRGFPPASKAGASANFATAAYSRRSSSWSMKTNPPVVRRGRMLAQHGSDLDTNVQIGQVNLSLDCNRSQQRRIPPVGVEPTVPSLAGTGLESTSGGNPSLLTPSKNEKSPREEKARGIFYRQLEV
jgi:hypothetical protein